MIESKIDINFQKLIYRFLIGTLILLQPVFCFADVVIDEIMYDPKGADSSAGGEWIEIHNTSLTPIDLTQWIFFENDTNHKIIADGPTEVPADGYAVISSNLDYFKNYFSGSVLLFKSSFSLNDGEHISLKSGKDAPETSPVDYVSDWGAKNDGNSLQLSNGNWIAASPTPGMVNGSNDVGLSTIPPDSNDGNTDSGNQSGNDMQSAGTITVAPVEPQIFTSITADKTATVGVETIFQGTTVGLKKEPIDNARYVWTFGDGGRAEGQSVAHSYFEPGDYLVILNASSGRYVASSRQVAKVLPLGVSIINVKEGDSGSITLKNSLSSEVNISRWILRSAGKTFAFPTPTVILAGASVHFPSEITGISADSNITELFYPNGALATKFESSNIATLSKVSVPPAVSEEDTFKEATKSHTETLVASDATSSKISENIRDNQSVAFSSSTLIYSADVSESGASGRYIDWFLAIFGLVGVGAAGVLFSRGKKTANGQSTEKPLTAEDFEIIEEKED